MSALSLSPSPSPILSPRASFHAATTSPRAALLSSQRASASARLSPRLAVPAESQAQQRWAFHAPSSATSPPQSSRHYSFGERDVPIRSSVRYIDKGTQYSPECDPPTADNLAAAAAAAPAEQVRPARAAASARKRKDVASPSEPSADHMNSAVEVPATRAGAAGDAKEPDVRQDPIPAADQVGTPPPAVQEARSTHGYPVAPKRLRPDPATATVMPSRYETCDPKDLGKLISHMLMELIRINDQIPLRDGRLTRFHSRAPPGIGVSDYLQRLIHHATLSPPILLSMVYYIDRLCTMYTNFTINSLTVHRFLITAATVAAKGLSDSFWTNPTYARIGGIPVSELATLELELLQRVQWKIVPNPEVLEDYYSSLVDRTDGYTLESSDWPDSSSVDEDSRMTDEPG